ncbi:MAG: hypothetical protein ACE5Z5_10055 [Candidatus Bathyarchaeia archaeon]
MMCVRAEKRKIEIRMTIAGELARRLTRIKEYYQFESYTEVIRNLITLKYEEIAARRE